MSRNRHIRGGKSHRAEKIASTLGKKSHVHRVIVLKQIADHKLNDPTVRVMGVNCHLLWETSTPFLLRIFHLTR